MAARILLVEDNRDDEELTLLAFEHAGVDAAIEVARDGEAALDSLFTRAAADLPRVVLLDLNLPRLSGIEVLRRLRADPRTRLVPVVVMTSSVEPRDLVACYAAGANSYVRKPVDQAAFDEVTRSLARYWLSFNEPAGRAP